VSARYVYFWRTLGGGKDLCDGHVGFMGVASSALILYEGIINMMQS
jgi:hypothetical protein